MQVTTLAVDLLQLAANYNYGADIGSAKANDSSVKLLSYHDKFIELMGTNVSALVPDEQDWEFAHEAGVYLPSTKKIYIASQASNLTYPGNITVIESDTFKLNASYLVPGIPMPNGGARYNDTHLLFCAFGTDVLPSTLTLFEPISMTTTVVLSSFYGRNFSSVNDVRIHPDGSIWFTDDYYGALQGYRPPPVMPPQVYRLDPHTGVVRVVADGFSQPNGLEFSSDFETLYINDSGYVQEPGHFNGTRPNTIYAYDVTHNSTRLANRRVFAYGQSPFVDGMHVDAKGNVWTTSGQGIMAWDPDGVLLGEIRVTTNVNNFMFVPDGILLLGFRRLWHIKCTARPRKSDEF